MSEKRFCLIDVNQGKEWCVSPCLKIKGHKGKHQHEGLCNNHSCMCYNRKQAGVKNE